MIPDISLFINIDIIQYVPLSLSLSLSLSIYLSLFPQSSICLSCAIAAHVLFQPFSSDMASRLGHYF